MDTVDAAAGPVQFRETAIRPGRRWCFCTGC